MTARKNGGTQSRQRQSRAGAGADKTKYSGITCPTCGRPPLAPAPRDDEAEAVRLRRELAQRIMRLRCRDPQGCADGACRRANDCMRRRSLQDGNKR